MRHRLRPAPACLLVLGLAGLCGCKRAPAGACAFDLGGEWVNASDSRYGYRLQDRGSEIAGEAFLREPNGKPQARDPKEPPVTFRLRRGPAEVRGEMRSPAVSLHGKQCLVDFEVRFSSCAPQKLQVTAEMTAPFDDACLRLDKLPDGGTPYPDLAEFVWVRPSTD